MEATEVLEEPSAARSLGRVGLVHMRQRFRPGQRSTLAVGEVIGHTPAGHAVDLGAWVDNQVDWSWPLYHKIAAAMKEAAKELNVAIVWGGDWKMRDGPHYELDRRKYP